MPMVQLIVVLAMLLLAGFASNCTADERATNSEYWETMVSFLTDVIRIRPDDAVAYGLKATALNQLGRYGEAEPLYRRALEINENAYDPWHPDVASSLNDLAGLLDTTGRYGEAEPLYRRALEINEKAYDPWHPDVASSLNDLAGLLRKTGRYGEAEPLYRRALEINEKAYGPELPEVASNLNNLALLLNTTGRYGEAEPLYRRALENNEKSYGPEHPHVAASLNNLAQLLETTGRYGEAEPLYRRALEINEKSYGPEHPELALCLNNLALLLDTTGRFDEAEPLHRRSLEILEKAHGPEHPDVAMSVNNLARLLHATGRYGEAEPLYRRALEINEKSYGPEHPGVAASLNNLAQLLETTGRYAEAEPLYRRAYQIAALAGDPDTLRIVQGNLMQVYTTSQPHLAIFYGKQAVNTAQSLRAGLSTTTQDTQQAFTEKVSVTYQNLANLLIDQGRLPEAEQVLAMLKEQEYFDFVRRDASADAPTTEASYARHEAPWAERYAEIHTRLVALGREHTELARIQQDFRTPEQVARLAQLDTDLDTGRAEVLAFIDQVKAEFAQLGADLEVKFGEKELAELDMMPSTLRSLHEQSGQEAVLIHYVATQEWLRILITTKDVMLHRESPITGIELNRLVAAYRAVLQEPWSDPLPLAQQLYDALIRPIRDDLAQTDARTLMVSVSFNSTLRYLPMAALHDGQHWLTEDYGVALYTAAARGNLKEEPQPQWRVAGLGVSRGGNVGGQSFSPLPSVPLELSSIVRGADDTEGVLLGVRYLDDTFTSQSLVESLRQRYPVLHLATHFHFAPGGTDADSYLLLGDGQALTLADLRLGSNFDMGAVDLLTLSACDTAMGENQADGSEVEGLGALAQRRGAKAVVATLWSVADASTGVFMRTLYASRQQQELTKAGALREAQLAFLDGRANATGIPEALRGAQRVGATLTIADYRTDPDKPFAHPYYWAPFVLMGNWL